MILSREGVSRKTQSWVPDFFIVGAMKCGTTTLHHALAQHADIFIPDAEIFFFDIDDYIQHPIFFPYEDGQWGDQDYVADFDRNLGWYRQFFEAAEPGQVIGEDSTTYLASPKAPARIAALNPDARILIMLRDPADRAYSAYWHLLRYGRAEHSFEHTLLLNPESLLSRSDYLPQLQRYYELFPAEQIRVVLFEEYVANPAAVLTDILGFLGVSPEVSDGMTGQHSNAGRVPRYPWLARLRNRLLWRLESRHFYAHLPDAPPRPRDTWLHLLDRLHRRVNPAVRKAPKMHSETRRFLNRLFRRECAGLDELIDRDLNRYWFREN